MSLYSMFVRVKRILVIVINACFQSETNNTGTLSILKVNSPHFRNYLCYLVPVEKHKTNIEKKICKNANWFKFEKPYILENMFLTAESYGLIYLCNSLICSSQELQCIKNCIRKSTIVGGRQVAFSLHQSRTEGQIQCSSGR